jgi:drug/metabolite transporter (DMT)-like permease
MQNIFVQNIAIFASIALSTSLFVVFKLMGKYKIPVFPIIVINYITCTVLGNLLLWDQHLIVPEIYKQPGFWPLFLLGFVFVITFFLMAKSTEISGATATSMASKMSVIIPVALAIIFFKEPFTTEIFIGLTLALFSVYLISAKKSEGQSMKFNWTLILVFIGSGIVDSSLNAIKKYNFDYFDNYKMATLTFTGAMIMGVIVSVIKTSYWKNFQFKWLFWGILLGTLNLLSVVALYSAMDDYRGNTGTMFILNNVGVVLLSAAIGFFFKEKFTRLTFVGLACAILAIVFLG